MSMVFRQLSLRMFQDVGVCIRKQFADLTFPLQESCEMHALVTSACSLALQQKTTITMREIIFLLNVYAEIALVSIDI